MEQIELLRYLLEALERLDVPYALVGSVASAVYGEPRMTRDIDVVISLQATDIERILASFDPDEFYVSREAIDGAVAHKSMFNIIHATSGNKIDFMISRDDAWGQAQMQRRRRVLVLPDLEGYIASPEDVIIGKLLYYSEGGSEKHLRDIAGILKVSGESIDPDYLSEWAERLGLGDIWEAVRSSGEFQD